MRCICLVHMVVGEVYQKAHKIPPPPTLQQQSASEHTSISVQAVYHPIILLTSAPGQNREGPEDDSSVNMDPPPCTRRRGNLAKV